MIHRKWKEEGERKQKQIEGAKTVPEKKAILIIEKISKGSPFHSFIK